jgi:hypothetical protein
VAPHTGPLSPESTHAPEGYDQAGEFAALQLRDRLFIRCEGGPSTGRLERFPPHLEVRERDGTYVLVDDRPREEWYYLFIPAAP